MINLHCLWFHTPTLHMYGQGDCNQKWREAVAGNEGRLWPDRVKKLWTEMRKGCDQKFPKLSVLESRGNLQAWTHTSFLWRAKTGQSMYVKRRQEQSAQILSQINNSNITWMLIQIICYMDANIKASRLNFKVTVWALLKKLTDYNFCFHLAEQRSWIKTEFCWFKYVLLFF